MSLFDEPLASAYLIKQGEFLHYVEMAHFDAVILRGCGGKGFSIIGIVDSAEVPQIYVLISQRSHIRYIKSPDVAHRLLVKMGVKAFQVDAKMWNMECVFNPHKASQKSRNRRRLKEEHKG